MQKILGKEISESILERLRALPTPKEIFAAIIVGDDPSSVNFVAQKGKIAKSLGIDFRIHRLSPLLKNDGLRKAVREIARKKTVGGVIVQLPLPKGVNKHYVMNTIAREKDVDVLGERALKLFREGKGILPPAAGTVKEILETHEVPLSNLRAAVIGKGFLVGNPVAAWLKPKVKDLVVFQSKSENIQKELKNFDLIVSGVGKANLFSVDDVKDDAFVIDFGWDRVDGKITGDFSPNTLDPKPYTLLRYTPTPGGTGPILVAKLLENFYTLNK